jgi:hypothetical protein
MSPTDRAPPVSIWKSGQFRIGPDRRPSRHCYPEPAYGCSFASGHPQLIDVSGGLLIGIARSCVSIFFAR